MCGAITCNNAAGQYLPGHFSSTSNCLAPSVITPASKTAATAAACVVRLFADPCANVPCTTTASQCPVGQWPFCYDYAFAKNSPTDCCSGCIDPCFTFNLQNNASIAAGKGNLCPAVSNQCGAGQVFGPGHPGSCCAACVGPCEGVACANQPTSQANCPAGTHFVPRPTTPTTCPDCCNSCKAGAAALVGIVGSASSVALTFAAIVACVAAMLL